MAPSDREAARAQPEAVSSWIRGHAQVLTTFDPERLGFVDAVLGDAGPTSYLLDLHTSPPDSIRAWLEEPAKLRLIGPRYDPADDASMTGGSLVEWFDIIIHTREVRPTRSLG